MVCVTSFVTYGFLKDSVRVLDGDYGTFSGSRAFMSASEDTAEESLIVCEFKKVIVCFEKVTAARSVFGVTVS